MISGNILNIFQMSLPHSSVIHFLSNFHFPFSILFLERVTKLFQEQYRILSQKEKARKLNFICLRKARTVKPITSRDRKVSLCAFCSAALSSAFFASLGAVALRISCIFRNKGKSPIDVRRNNPAKKIHLKNLPASLVVYSNHIL